MSGDFQAAFAELRAMMLRHADGLSVTRDNLGDLVVRTPYLDPKGQPGWFGTVTIKKSYVAYHLTALYAHPQLAAALSPELERRRQGKTCFNFKAADPALIGELERLTRAVRAAVDRAR